MLKKSKCDVKLFLSFALSCLFFLCNYYSVFSQNLPEWFFEPADIKNLGVLGFSNPSLLGENHSWLLAECYALKSYLSLIDSPYPLKCPLPSAYISKSKIKKFSNQLDKKLKELGIKLERKKIFLPQYETTIFAVHLYKKPKSEYPYYKDSQLCSLENCKPEYLCNPSIEGYAGAVGIAFHSYKFSKQYEIALNRALDLFFYAYGSTVKAKEYKKVVNSGLTSFRLRLSHNIVTPSKKRDNLRFLVRGMCIDREGSLFVYLITPDIKVKKEKTEPCWINNPTCLGEHVYVGVAKPNIYGLKGQIQMALKRALINMAKSLGIEISSEIIRRKIKNPFGKIEFTYIDYKSQTIQKVSAYIIGIYKKGNLIFVGVKAKH